MKKTSYIILTVLTIFLSGVLMACSLKKPEASFTQSEIVVSLNETVDLDESLSVSGVSKSNIKYKFSNSKLFNINENSISAIASGTSYVYATYKNNNLASMKISVKKVFSTPTNLVVTQDGYITWDEVSGFYENDIAPVKPQSYTISGTFVPYSTDGQAGAPQEINQTVTQNRYQLTQDGVYTLTVSANAFGYFDKSSQTESKTFYFGFMPELSESDITFSEGVVSWSAVAGADYRVKVDDMLFTEQSGNSLDVSRYLDTAESGNHSISVIVYDAQDKKIAKESECITVEKLAVPYVEYDFSSEGGVLKLSASDNVENFVVSACNVETQLVQEINVGKIGSFTKTSLEGLSHGLYEIKVQASTSESNCYKSSYKTVETKVYKLSDVTLTGNSDVENLANGTELNAKVNCGSTQVTNKISISGADFDPVDGIAVGETEKEFIIQLSEAKKYSLSAKLLPNQENNIVGEESVYVLNSNSTPVIEVVKVGEFGDVTHEYVETGSARKSKFSFDVFDETVVDYILKNNGVTLDEGQYNWTKNSGKIEIVLNGVVDDFEVASFEIVTKTANDLLAINSSYIKTFQVLSAPTTANSGNSTNKEYSWTPSENADQYLIKIYTLPNKNGYDEFLSGVVDTAGLSFVTEIVNTGSYTFDEVGYYYVEIVARTTNVNEFLSAKTSFNETFYISEKLVVNNVQLGYKDSYANGLTESTGYFVRLENADNIDSYVITVGGTSVSTFDIETDDEVLDYLLTERFVDGETGISVVAKSNDNTLHIDSDEKILKVVRQEKITYNNVEVDDSTNNIKVSARQGATEILIKRTDNENEKASGNSEYDAVFNIENRTNVSLKFSIKGSRLTDDVYGLIDGKVYLNSEETTLDFKRIETPTNFKYYDGKLYFVNNDTTEMEFVLDVVGVMANGDTTEITVKFGSSMANVLHNGNSISIGQSSLYRSISDGNVTIDFDKLLNVMKSTEEIKNIYNQATEIKFRVRVYKKGVKEGAYALTSLPATLDSQSGTLLQVQKMSAPTLEFIKETVTDFTFGWNGVSVDESRNSETTYEIYLTTESTAINGDLLLSSDGYHSYEFSKTGYNAGRFYSFYMVAKNPYYLESSTSNMIRIYKLNTLSKISINKSGELIPNISSSDQDFVSKIKVNGVEQDVDTISPSLGALTVELVGKEETNDDVITYYLNSEVSTWQVVNFGELAPADKAVTYSVGLLKWTGFTAGISQLKYKVIFKDEDGNSVSCVTTATQLDLLNNDEVYDKINTLSSGDITVQVVAYLESYEVSLSGATTIYYSAEQSLLNGEKIYNAFIYGDTVTKTNVVKKSTTPQVTKVEFEQVDFSDVEFDEFGTKNPTYDLLKPVTTISFMGNYADEISISAFINDLTTPIYVGNVTKGVDDVYSFEIPYEDLEFVDNKVTVSIKVNSSDDIPSSLGYVEIGRSVDLRDIEFYERTLGIDSTVKLIFATEGENCGSAGGVVVKVDYKQTGDVDTKTLYSLIDVVEINVLNPVIEIDMSEFIKTYMQNGGEIKISAHLNSYVDATNKVYYLPSQRFTATETIPVLKAVEESEIVRKAGGFVINTANSDSTVYIVEYGTNRTAVTCNLGEFYYEFPDDWVNGTYSLTINATEEDKILSAKTTLDFELTRISSVTNVRLVRDDDDLSKISFEWDEVENAGGYILRMYDKLTGNKVFEKNILTTKTYVGDIFGENYQDVIGYGIWRIGDFVNDREVLFEIVTVGKENSGVIETNNSYAKRVNGVIKGNNLLNTSKLENKISIDQFGRISVDLPNDETFLYNFYTSTKEQGWREVVSTSSGATCLDSLAFSKEIETTLFDVNILRKGNQEEFEMDSYIVTSEGTSFTLQFNVPFSSVGYNENLSSSIAFEILANSYNKVYVGTTENALFDGSILEVPIEKTSVPANETTLNEVVACNFGQLIELLTKNGKTFDEDSEVSLYFWTTVEDSAEKVNKIVASKPYEFKFKYVTENAFVDIKKNGNSVSPSDYANVYATYNNLDSTSNVTRGVFVKISCEDGYETIKYYTKDQIKSADSVQFIINITEIFEENDLISRVGKFNVSFARLQVENDSTFVITNWVDSYDSSEIEFLRLEPTVDLRLLNGNLAWTKITNDAKYYIYFALSVDAETLKMNTTSVYSTDKNVFDVSNFVGSEKRYYMAVQSYREDLMTLPSRTTFITQTVDEVTSPVPIYTSRISSPLVLEDGQLRINWTEDSEIYKLLTIDFSNILEFSALLDSDGKLALPFSMPFTFNPVDLVNDRVEFRLKFTPLDYVGKDKYYDVNAKYLFADLYKYLNDKKGMTEADTDARLDVLATYCSSAGLTSEVLAEFKNICKTSSYGIGNYRKLFDEIFETLQSGYYSMQYCLLGTTGDSVTINSVWKDFVNSNGEKRIYVNGQPNIKVLTEENEDDSFTSTYKMLIKKLQVIDYDGEYKKVDANSYVMKLKLDSESSMAFSIAGGSGSYSLSLIDYNIDDKPTISTTVSVYETDEYGNRVIGGEYLMFYINHNGGNSLLGVFGNVIPKNSFDTQVYAVGNNYSTSSKSEYYSMTFLGFGDNLSVNNGTFAWVPQQRRTTTVITKSSNSFGTVVENVYAQDDTYARYKLDNLGEGAYDYIKFVMKGEVIGNYIYIDSEIYTLNNIYKLIAPKLSNDLGFVAINDAENDAKYSQSYSDTNIYKYRVYNNSIEYNESNPSSYCELSNFNYQESKTLYYQTGISGDEAFMENEKSATEFYVISLGSNIENIKYKTIETVVGNYNTSYHLRELYCVATGEVSEDEKGVAIASASAKISAQMMSDVGYLSVENSVLHWNNVNTSQNDELNVKDENIIYRINVTLYETTAVDGSITTETNTVDKLFTYYTAQTEFDFVKIEDDIRDYWTDRTLLKVSVSALALDVVDETALLQGQRIKLIEGMSAQGNVMYDSSESFVLLGSPCEMSEISRFDEVFELKVVDGKLSWSFRAESGLSETDFKDRYGFSVVQSIDGKETEVEGVYSIIESENGIYQITFNENEDSLKAGNSTIKVYVTQGEGERVNMIKSFSTSIDIIKLETIQDGDYIIENDTIDTAIIEILDFSGYFAIEENKDNTIAMRIYFNEYYTEDIEFTSTKCKLYVLKEENAGLDYSGEFVGRIIVEDDKAVKLTFLVRNNKTNTIYSDQSREFLLQRSNWGEGKAISWDTTAQLFSWEYDYNAVNSTIKDAQIVEGKYVSILNTTLYLDKQCTNASEIILVSGTGLEIEESDAVSTKINYNEQSYYIKNGSYDFKYLNKAVIHEDVYLYKDESCTEIAKDADETDVKLEKDLGVLILSELENSTKILYQNVVYYIPKLISGENGLDVETYFVQACELMLGDLVKVVNVGTYSSIVETESQQLVDIDNSKIVKPVYTVTAKYGDDDITTRVYTTENNTFTPEIIGKVTISVSVKLGLMNVQSVELKYAGTVNFDLFASGEGTAIKPYQIDNSVQFENIKYRMTKDECLSDYTEIGVGTKTIENKYYFKINADISNLEIDGIAFKGDFSGAIDGNGHEISYSSKKLATLSNSITVDKGNVLGINADHSSTEFLSGSALFERFTDSAKVSNLKIRVSFAEGGSTISSNSLIAGLVITNSGEIDNVNIAEFKTTFVGSVDSRLVIVYSGVASNNTGNKALISNCSFSTTDEINFSDSSSEGEGQLLFVSGIAYVNWNGAKIANCTTGVSGSKISVKCFNVYTVIQVAGVVVTNYSATLENCTNNFNLYATGAGTEGANLNYMYIGGIACYGKGTTQNNINNGTIMAENISASRLKKGDIYAVV